MSSRRDFLKCAGLALAPQRPKIPNIVFLFADDLRFDTIHALGNPEIRTPNLDGLARAGTAFTHAFIMGGTQGAVCVPSRAMLLTGQTLFRADKDLIGKDAPERAVTFPELFKQQGYVSFGIGKWHNNPRLFTRSFTGGENVFFGGMSDQWKVPVADYDPSGEYPKQKRRTGAKFSSELFTDSAVRFLREYKGDKPFLLYVAYTAPHDPRTPPKEYLDMYPPEKIALPKSFLPEHPFDNGEMKIRDEQLAPWPRTPEVIREHTAGYYGMITSLDAQIGRILKTLEETGRAGDTIVVFTGDNGLAVGRHGLMGKQNLYEHSVRVPLLMRGPGVPRGRTSGSFCYLLDLYPTLCALAGLTPPGSVEGKSLAPVLKDPRKQIRDTMFFAYRSVQRAVRTERWKLILYNVGGRRTTQLFDIRKDPWELNNLAAGAAQAGRVAELTALLKKWMKETGDPLDLGTR
ncbi:MAG: sulfatase-like hydrolase/transferase [Acidobacteriota bacterium]